MTFFLLKGEVKIVFVVDNRKTSLNTKKPAKTRLYKKQSTRFKPFKL